MVLLDGDPPPSLIELLPGAGIDALTDLVAEDATFSSPAADYHGRADVVHMLSLIAGLLEVPTAQSTTTDGPRD